MGVLHRGRATYTPVDVRVRRGPLVDFRLIFPRCWLEKDVPSVRGETAMTPTLHVGQGDVPQLRLSRVPSTSADMASMPDFAEWIKRWWQEYNDAKDRALSKHPDAIAALGWSNA